jgi:uncharacterized DUF497 family protein
VAEWDSLKAAANFRKHGVRFADGEAVLQDPLAVTISDPQSEDEERFITVGADDQGRVLVVVYTWRGDNARLISVRQATARERRTYEADR